MKKKIIMFCSIMVLIIANVCHADYPTYLNGNSNYILCDGHMGTGWFIQKDSIEIYKTYEQGPVLMFSVVSVDNADKGNTDIYNRESVFIGYDIGNIKMYYVNGIKGNRYLDPNGSASLTRPYMAVGEKAFYLFFNSKFYGILSNKNGYKVFSDNFYNRM